MQVGFPPCQQKGGTYRVRRIASRHERGSVTNGAVGVLGIHDVLNHLGEQGAHLELIGGGFKADRCIVQPPHALIPLRTVREDAVQVGTLRGHAHFVQPGDQRVSAAEEGSLIHCRPQRHRPYLGPVHGRGVESAHPHIAETVIRHFGFPQGQVPGIPGGNIGILGLGNPQGIREEAAILGELLGVGQGNDLPWS